jgi:hypothetical protein
MLNDERELRHMLWYRPGSGKKVPFNFAQQLAERQNSMLMHQLSLYAGVLPRVLTIWWITPPFADYYSL